MDDGADVDRISFEDRVAVVTGAGGGLGRQHTLVLADRGAKVVVNDLGSTRDGSGIDRRAADAVVDEILEAGGDAVASHDGVHTWDGARAVVRTAIDTYGRVDVIVNNAGILRDVSFGNLDEASYDAVVDVHLKGSFGVARAAWDYFKAQGYGRIINTSSGSGLYGNFGQASYAAAKLGVVGLTRVLAIEGARYGITCHAIAPLAASRMTEDVLPEGLLARLEPAHVSGLVAWLASESCGDTGGIWSVGGGHVARVAILEAAGVTFDDPPTPEAIAARWGEIRTLDDAIEPMAMPDQADKIARVLGLDST